MHYRPIDLFVELIHKVRERNDTLVISTNIKLWIGRISNLRRSTHDTGTKLAL